MKNNAKQVLKKRPFGKRLTTLAAAASVILFATRALGSPGVTFRAPSLPELPALPSETLPDGTECLPRTTAEELHAFVNRCRQIPAECDDKIRAQWEIDRLEHVTEKAKEAAIMDTGAIPVWALVVGGIAVGVAGLALGLGIGIGISVSTPSVVVTK